MQNLDRYVQTFSSVQDVDAHTDVLQAYSVQTVAAQVQLTPAQVADLAHKRYAAGLLHRLGTLQQQIVHAPYATGVLSSADRRALLLDKLQQVCLLLGLLPADYSVQHNTDSSACVNFTLQAQDADVPACVVQLSYFAGVCKVNCVPVLSSLQPTLQRRTQDLVQCLQDKVQQAKAQVQQGTGTLDAADLQQARSYADACAVLYAAVCADSKAYKLLQGMPADSNCAADCLQAVDACINVMCRCLDVQQRLAQACVQQMCIYIAG